MNAIQLQAIERHGRKLLAIFPRAKERDPVKLCKKLRALEVQGNALAVRMCNEDVGEAGEKLAATLLVKVNTLLGNVREYQPKTGAACGCRRGVERDNCPACEGTGRAIDFAAVRNAPPLVPVFFNGDPRGYTFKIDDAAAKSLDVHKDWGGYGIIAPEIGKDGA